MCKNCTQETTETETMVDCYCCGKPTNEEELVYCDENREQYCEDCANDHLFTCDHCDDVSLQIGSERVSGEQWCESCVQNDAFYCEDCDSFHSGEEMNSVEDGQRYVCDRCRDYDYTWCEHCDTYHHDNDMPCVHCRDDGNVYSYHDVEVTSVCGYGDYDTTDNGARYYIGTELELETGSDPDTHELLIDRLNGDGILMKDSSIRNGVELITKPMSFQQHVGLAGRLFGDLRSHGVTVHRGIGLHVNISRNAFHDNHALAYFLLNINIHDDITRAICGRESDRWANIEKKSVQAYLDDACTGTPKYLAARVDSSVIEVRCPMSTTMSLKYLGRIAWVLETVKYSNDCYDSGIFPTRTNYLHALKSSNDVNAMGVI